MKRQGRIAMLCFAVLALHGCVGQIWTGAMMVYDRHNVYEKIEDYQLAANVNYALFHDKTFKRPDVAIDVAAFNDDILIAGHVPTPQLRRLAISRLRHLEGRRDLYNQLAVKAQKNNTVQDSLITMQIRAQIFADSSINPKAFKVVTSDRIVYVMGEVKPQQARTVLAIASNTPGVIRVVKLLKYYHLTRKPDLNAQDMLPKKDIEADFQDG